MSLTLTIPLDVHGTTLTVHADSTVDLSAELAMLDVATVRQLVPAGLTARPTTPAPTPGAPASSGQGPGCVHGARVHRAGVNASTQEPWSGWFCPTPKGTQGQCPPIFDRTRTAAPAAPAPSTYGEVRTAVAYAEPAPF